jgi:hypothetical protein
MVFQIHTISDVVEVDCIIRMVSEPRHQHLTNGEGQVLLQVMRCIHGGMGRVQGVGEDVHLVYVFQTNIVGLTNPICNYSQFGIIRCSKTSSRPVLVEVPLMPEAKSCD